MQYWLNTIKFQYENRAKVIVIINEDHAHEKDRISQFLREYPPTIYQIHSFLTVKYEEIETEISLRIFKILSNLIEQFSLDVIENSINFTNANLLLNEIRTQHLQSKAPFISYSQYIRYSIQCNLQSEIKQKEALDYLIQLGSVIHTNDIIIFNVLWLNKLLVSISPKCNQNHSSNQAQSTGKSKNNYKNIIKINDLTQILMNAFPIPMDLQSIFEFFGKASILYIANSIDAVIFPSALPFYDNDKSSQLISKLDNPVIKFQFRLNYLPIQLLHQVSVSLYGTCMKYSSTATFIYFCFGEWAFKSTDGNVIFYYANRVTGELVFASTSTSYSSLLDDLVYTVEQFMPYWPFLGWQKSKTVLQK